VKGMHARGAFIVDFSWKDGQVVQASIQSLNGEEAKIILPGNARIKNAVGRIVGRSGKNSHIVRFATEKKGIYTISFN
jgi:alpha-L-fucosidase 2